MCDTDPLWIPLDVSEAEHRVRGSRFIAVVRPAATVEKALEHRNSERRRFHDATHHVLAVRLANGDERSDDDGEPAGTAGRPVLAAIDREGLRDAAVVVTRYFGGTKLGTGGLARAYGEAASLALARVPRRRFVTGARVRVRFEYDDTGAVARLLDSHGAVRLGESYGPHATVEVGLPAKAVAGFEGELTEATSGRARAQRLPGALLLPSDT